MEDSGFSGVVRLSNVSDFIAPNLDCIIPLETKKVEKEVKDEVKINARMKKKEKLPEKPAVKITLADCLACNGCITSAETVLIEEQSFGKLWQGVSSSKLSVITISPQTITSLAVKLETTPQDMAIRISQFFKKRRVHHVIDSSFARHFAHRMLLEELHSTPATSRPLLSSACPGFVCYAEKSHGELLIPRISKIRSPQAITGALIKHFLAKKLALSPCEIFHAAVMPCFDKKLEASRDQFKVDGTQVQETDCVVSSAELLEEMTKEEQEEVIEGSEDVEEENWLNALGRGHIIGEEGGASGGYADRIVSDFIAENGGTSKTETLNKNLFYTTVTSPSGDVTLRVAKVYGFRNIQNLVRKMKTKKEKTDYVEVMACPGGCANGGGQVRYDTIGEREEKLKLVEENYNHLSKNSHVLEGDWEKVKNEWDSIDENWRRFLYTDYKTVETNVTQALKW
uniref:Fe_hyd_lg_C domain-containing protein n=1 Tax=Caenorhabditis japonica TaxID=281687 RepID=A0A8R1HPB7_CAEJA